MSNTQKSSRLVVLDLLRGYFLLAIILNHLSWYPNGLDWVAMRGDLFVTSAEGFFLISGIVLGIVRGAKLKSKPFKKAATLLLNRGAHLYIASIVLMLVFTLIGWWFLMDNPGLKPGIRPIDEPFWNVIMGALSFNYIYGWADYLRLYALFILISPLALWLLRRGMWYIVLLISVVVWSLFPEAGTSLKTNELLMPIAWQLIFFSGFIIGFYHAHIAKWWRSLSATVHSLTIRLIIGAAGVTLALNVLLVFGIYVPGPIGQFFSSTRIALDPFFMKESLPVPRLALFTLWFAAAFFVFKRFEKTIIKYLGWILIPFGTNSLYVYIIHAFVIFFAHLIISPENTNIFVNAIGSVLVVALIWLAVHYKVLMKIIPR